MKKRLSITLCSILVGLTAVTCWLVLCQSSPAQAAPGARQFNQDAAASIRYVAPNGSDNIGCSASAEPCKSPQ
jgi:hypothetical protein